MSKNINSSKELTDIPAYELVMEENLEELKSLGLVFNHKKTGARVIVLSNDDDNKVFSIGFRTPPADSTGVAHIIEHSVLCGSKKFPAKDPFVELVKGSLNTFLNAMTYPDKTIYPVASYNEKDFKNLMEVYLDAVFYPNIYKREEIFKQEGWHYELEDLDGEIKYNGVVYNEMKGAFSSPEQLLYRLIQHSLYPDTAYGTESGGNPDFIPDLTYEDYLDFHRKYYHPTNSYIYLYGDVDIEEKLNWIDKEYLMNFDKITIDSAIHKQPPFVKVNEVTEYYSIAEGESGEEKTYLSYNVSMGTSLERELYLAFQVLDYVLLDAPGAPLKQALLDAGIGQDIISSFDNGILQPCLAIIAKNTDEDKKERFLQVIKATLDEIISKGIDPKGLKAAINYFEFKYREADFGAYPKGLMYGIQILDSWLYDDGKPFIHIRANETFAFLKNQVGTRYFEDLIKEYILENPHASLVVVKPKPGLTTRKEEDVKKKLSDYKASLSKEELLALIEDTKNLKKYQEEPSSKEDIEKIPLLNREDIEKKARPIYNEEKEEAGIKVLHHNVFTNGIGYIKLLFNVKNIPQDKFSYLGLLSTMLGYVDTNKHSFLDFSNEVNIHTGGIHSTVSTYSQYGKLGEFTGMFEIKAKALYEELPSTFELINEMIHETNLKDEKRLLEILSEVRSRLQMKMNSSGHLIAASRSTSYYSPSAYFDELTSGISFYRFIDDLIINFEAKKTEVIQNLEELVTCIFRKENLLISYTADEEGYEALVNQITPFAEQLSTQPVEKYINEIRPKMLNEGFKTSSQVQYVARSGNFIRAGYEYTGALKVLRVILNYDYLWINLRVKGGAYGCMSGFGYTGNGYFVSYRDPNLRETNDIYAKTEQYVKNFNADERDMTKYIIGTISGIDTPLTPSAKGTVSLSAYLSGITETQLQKERDQILSADVESIRALSGIVKSIIDAGNICVIGNEQKIEENKDLFMEVKNLM
ncbi:hypothetical protein EDD66_10843 [Mobilisporobacter senegalensis]|uniref:Peptidase M16C associated domain-containing protein n=2 Tax=Mobilisporobacter senegalensis TaxID=1329262 RepID=A0A3N1XJJ7_9FIRM|nr:hypothetical protein EDD66_10843 [Mobilisporobacter senegalensis]